MIMHRPTLLFRINKKIDRQKSYMTDPILQARYSSPMMMKGNHRRCDPQEPIYMSNTILIRTKQLD